MITYKLLNKTGLHDFINSTEFQQLRSIPISKHRALSHIHNPRADEKDILLILAYSENEIIGYLGIVPDLVFISDNKSFRCGSLSCIWVDAQFRGKGVSLTLIKKAHENYDKIIGTGYVPAIEKMYDSTLLFDRPLKFEGVRLYMRMDLHSILPPKGKFFQLIKPILRLTDAFLNFFLDIRFLFHKKRNQQRIEYPSQVDDETSKFIHERQHKQLFRRNKQELNWIINYPWIHAQSTPDRDSERYYFASIDKSFDSYCLKLRGQQDQLIGFLFFTKRNRELKLSYCYFEPNALPIVVNIITEQIYKWKINMFTTFHPELSKYFMDHKTGVIYKKRIIRPYLFTHELHELLKDVDFEIQDGDADLAFT